MRILVLVFILALQLKSSSLTGIVLDKLSNEKIEAKLYLVNKSGQKLKETATSYLNNGLYTFDNVPKNFSGKILVQKAGYFDFETDFIIPAHSNYSQFSKDIELIPKKNGAVLELSVSPFDYGKANLRGGFEIFLEDIVIILKKNITLKFEIIAYPDAKEDDNDLSRKRIDKLIDYFHKLGISKQRFVKSPKIILEQNNSKKLSKGKRNKGKIYFKITQL
jgi:outer membrane protein OmpA-like peptidoglycan-associated protein